MSRTTRRIVQIAAAAVLVVVTVVAVAMLARRDSEVVASPPTKRQAVASVSPHDVCVAQLIAMVSYMVDKGNMNDEMTINGTSDPFLRQAGALWSKTVSDRYAYGDTEAIANLRASAQSTCTSELRDAVRQNYPTDGTTPW